MNARSSRIIDIISKASERQAERIRALEAENAVLREMLAARDQLIAAQQQAKEGTP